MIRLTGKIIPLLAFFILHFSNDVFAQSNTVLQLDGNGTDKIINEGANLILTCVGDENAIFYYPNENSKGNVEQRPDLRSTINGTVHGVKFVRTSVTPQDTGYYGCVHTASEVHKNRSPPSKDSWIYVYVKSNQSLIVDTTEIFMTGYKNHNIVMPCRSTSPDYSFYLEKLAPVHWDYKKALDNGKIVFEPRIEFTMKNLNVNDVGAYKCRISNNETGITQSRRINVFVSDVPELKLITTETHAIMGQKFSVQCMIKVSPNYPFELQWLKPNKIRCPDSSEDDRITISRSRNEQSEEEIISLTIKNMTVCDQGEYECQVVSTELHVEPKGFWISVHDPPKLELVASKYAISGKEYAIKCQLNALASYQFKYYWTTPNNEIINENSTMNARVTSNITAALTQESGVSTQSFLTIKNITKSDNGKYTCVFLSETEPKTLFKNHSVKVYTQEESELTLTRETPEYSYGFVGMNKTFTGIISVSSVAMENLTVKWMHHTMYNTFIEMKSDDNYEISPPGRNATLFIKRVKQSDEGSYFLHVSNGIRNRKIIFRVAVYGEYDKLFLH